MERVSAAVVAVLSFAVVSLLFGAPFSFAATSVGLFGFAAVPVGRFVWGQVYPGRALLFTAMGFLGFAVAGVVGDVLPLVLSGTGIAVITSWWAFAHYSGS